MQPSLLRVSLERTNLEDFPKIRIKLHEYQNCGLEIKKYRRNPFFQSWHPQNYIFQMQSNQMFTSCKFSSFWWQICMEFQWIRNEWFYLAASCRVRWLYLLCKNSNSIFCVKQVQTRNGQIGFTPSVWARFNWPTN